MATSATLDYNVFAAQGTDYSLNLADFLFDLELGICMPLYVLVFHFYIAFAALWNRIKLASMTKYTIQILTRSKSWHSVQEKPPLICV